MNAVAAWILVAVSAVVVTQTLEQSSPAEPQSAPATTKPPQASQPAESPIVFGEVLPEINAAAWYPPDSGVTLTELRGKFVLLEFWRTKCQYCAKGHILMAHMQQKYGDKVAVIGLCKEPPEKTLPFVEKLALSYPMGVGSTTPREWRVPKVPYVFLIDPEGRLLWVSKPDDVEAVLKGAMAGTYPLCTDPMQVAQYEGQLRELERRAANGDCVRVWSDAMRIRGKFPLMHPIYEQAKKLMIEQIKGGKKKMARAKALLKENKREQARALLDEILRDYEGALLEREAAKLLRQANEQ